MPKKIRELMRDLAESGWQLERVGKGSHRKFSHPQVNRKVVLSGQDGATPSGIKSRMCKKQSKRLKPSKRLTRPMPPMKPSDVYFKWVEWSEEDGVYIGRCPDLFFGGCHGDNPVQVYAELCEIVDEVLTAYKRVGNPLPEVKTRPLAAA